MISYIIVSFDLAQMISSFIHAKTISKMGRKNAILIGFAIQIITLLGLSACAYIPPDYPQTFVWTNTAIRFVQGYGDSLTWTTCFSVINIIFKDDKAQKIGMAEAA